MKSRALPVIVAVAFLGLGAWGGANIKTTFSFMDFVPEGAPLLHEEYSGNINAEAHQAFGDVEAVFKDCDLIQTNRFINKRQEQDMYDLPADTELFARIEAIHQRRCQQCHGAAEVTRPYWVDLYAPEETLFLTAPLAKSAGGSQKCGATVYPDCSDKDYSAIAQWLEQAVERAWIYPRRDLRSLPSPR